MVSRSLLFIAATLLWTSSARAQLNQAQMVEALKKVDLAIAGPIDSKATWAFMQKLSDGEEKVWQVVYYRKVKEGSLVVLATSPRTEAGKGYIRLDKNLWFYDSTTGKWERRGEDRGFFARSSRRRDLDQWSLNEEYDAAYVAKEKVGQVEAHHLKLTLKKGVGWETDFPVWDLYIAADTGLPLKADQYADSGRLMRSMFVTKWLTKKDPTNGKEVVVPQEIRVFDQVDKGVRLQMVLRDIEFGGLDGSIFTKGWVEAKSR